MRSSNDEYIAGAAFISGCSGCLAGILLSIAILGGLGFIAAMLDRFVL